MRSHLHRALLPLVMMIWSGCGAGAAPETPMLAAAPPAPRDTPSAAAGSSPAAAAAPATANSAGSPSVEHATPDTTQPGQKTGPCPAPSAEIKRMFATA